MRRRGMVPWRHPIIKQAWAEAKSDHPAAAGRAECRQTASNLGWTEHGIRGRQRPRTMLSYDVGGGSACGSEISVPADRHPGQCQPMQQGNF